MSPGRALMLALALEAAEPDSRLTRFGRRKDSFYATLPLPPPECELLGLVEGPDGIELLWRPV